MSRFAADAGYKKSNAAKTLERMRLMSMVPLELDPANSSAEAKGALDRSFGLYKNTMADFTRALEYEGEKENVWDVELNIKPERERKITPYEPAIPREPHYYPEPASYNPEKPKPAPLLTSIARVPQTIPKKAATTADIVALYNKGVRDFNPDLIDPMVTISKDSPAPRRDSRVHSSFDKQMERRIEIARPTIAHNVPFFLPKTEPPKTSSFDDQSGRIEVMKVDPGRDYSLRATQQLDNLKAKRVTRILTFKDQRGRDDKPKKNERIQIMEDLLEQQQKMIEKIKPLRRVEVPKPRPRSTFEMQVARANTDPEPEKDMWYEPDIEKSLPHVWPKVRTTKIRPLSNSLDRELMWDVPNKH